MNGHLHTTTVTAVDRIEPAVRSHVYVLAAAECSHLAVVVTLSQELTLVRWVVLETQDVIGGTSLVSASCQVLLIHCLDSL